MWIWPYSLPYFNITVQLHVMKDGQWFENKFKNYLSKHLNQKQNSIQK
jgi:hypothetical protein